MGENILEPETVAGARARVLGTTWTDLVLEILGRILNPAQYGHIIHLSIITGL